MKASFGIILTALFSWFILHACMSQEQQEEILQNSEPQSVDVNVGGGEVLQGHAPFLGPELGREA